MKSIECFAGIGGIALAAEWAGIETVAFCEREPFCQQVLNERWPHVPLFDDITTLNRQVLEEAGVIERGGTVDIISGGWPCQPFASVNRQRKGSADERHLWPEMFRLIDELKPTWVVGENVADYAKSDEHEQTHRDLESIGYETQSFIFSAGSVGAPHQRFRTIVVAHSNNKPKLQADQRPVSNGNQRNPWQDTTGRVGGHVPGAYWSVYQPPVPGVDDGLPNRMERSKAIGNAVSPQQLYPVFEAIMELERARQ